MSPSTPSKVSEFSTSGPLPSRSGRILSGQPRTKQFFDWGYVNWLVEPDGPGQKKISVGEVTYYPNRGEPEHSHYGEEQVLHVISGQGSQVINGQSSSLKQGDTVYLPPYCSHSLTNTSALELNLLCIYNHHRGPATLLETEPLVEESPADLDLATIIELDSAGRLLNNLSQALKLSLRLYDTSGKCLVESARQPLLCGRMASKGGHCHDHIVKAIDQAEGCGSSRFFHCCGQVSSILIPVISGQVICGYIKCGEFFVAPTDRAVMRSYLREQIKPPPKEEVDRLTAEIPVEKRSRLHSAAEAASAVATYIAESGLAMRQRRELAENRLSIINEQMTTATLEKALKEADFKLLQSQINPHFLFNTLNIISQIAYMEGADRAAGLVCSLADLMRATLRKANQLVPLKEEQALLNDYLNIQKTRFAERLEAVVDIDPDLSEASLPILILQPLVENAIVHGLEPKLDACRVEITAKRIDGGRISLSVKDNGAGFSPDQSGKHKGLGLQSIRARLSHFFNDRFNFEIQSRPGQGTLIEITIPENQMDRPEQ